MIRTFSLHRPHLDRLPPSIDALRKVHWPLLPLPRAHVSRLALAMWPAIRKAQRKNQQAHCGTTRHQAIIPAATANALSASLARHHMQSASYVVHLIGCDYDPPFKHFGPRADAVEHSRSEVQSGNAELANIYEVAGSDAAAAIALWQAGSATHIQTCSRQASDSERPGYQKTLHRGNKGTGKDLFHHPK